MENRFSGSPPPPQANHRPTYQVLRPQKDGKLDLTLLTSTIFGVTCHWVVDRATGKGTSLACYQHEPKGCPYHDSRIDWAGFMPVWDWSQRKACVLRLSPRDADVMIRELGLDVNWYGKRVRIEPINKGEGRTIAVVQASEHEPTVKLKPHDIMHTIACILRCEEVPRQSPARYDDEQDVPMPPDPKDGE